MNIKEDLKLAFKPKLFSTLIKIADYRAGMKLMLIWGLIFLIINLAFALIQWLSNLNRSFLGLIGFNLLFGIALLIFIALDLIIIGAIGGWASKLFFKGAGSVSRSIAGTSHLIIPLVFLDFIFGLILLIDSTLFNIPGMVFLVLLGIIIIVELIWVFWLGSEALAWANNIKKSQGFVSFLIGFIVINLATWLVFATLVGIIAGILTAAGVF